MNTETIKFKTEEEMNAFTEKIQKNGFYENVYIDKSSYNNTVQIDPSKVLDAKELRKTAELRGGEFLID